MSIDLTTQNWILGPNRFSPEEKVEILRPSIGPNVSSRTEAVDRMTKKMNGGVKNLDSGFVLHVSRSNAKRSLHSKDVHGVFVNVIVNHVDELARHAIRIESHADIVHESSHVQAIHVFALPVYVKDELFRIQLLVRDYVDAKDERTAIHSIDGIAIEKEIEKTALAGTAIFSPLDAPKGRHTANASETALINNFTNVHQNVKKSIVLGDFLKTYIRADGLSYFAPVDISEYLSDGAYHSPIRDKIVSNELCSMYVQQLRTHAKSRGVILNRQSIARHEELFLKVYELYRLKGMQFSISKTSVNQIHWVMQALTQKHQNKCNQEITLER